jgi:SAM-dependent methyltransferase
MSLPGVTASPDVGDYQKLASVYDLLHPDRDIEVDFYVSLVDRQVSSILDLGCGTGALTGPLEAKRSAQHGCRGQTVGLDSSSAMLAQGRLRCRDVLWVEGDMRSPGVTGPFDLIVSGLNTIQHLLTDAEMLATFGSVRRLLAPSGIFAFDIFNPDPAFLQPLRQDSLVRRLSGPQGLFELRECTSYDKDNRVLTISWRLPPIDAGPGDTARFRMRQYWPEDISSLLAKAGLAVVDLYGDFAGGAFCSSAPRQVYRCRVAQ